MNARPENTRGTGGILDAWPQALMLAGAVGLTVLGVLVQSATLADHRALGPIFNRHLVRVAVALVGGLVCYRFALHRSFRASALFWLPCLLLLLVGVNLWGTSISGTRSFLCFAGLNIRPVVLVPFALALAVSAWHGSPARSGRLSLRLELALCAGTVALCLYAGLGHHWKIALLVPLALACGSLLAGGRRWLLWAAAALLTLSFFAIFLTLGSSERLERILGSWIHFEDRRIGEGFQTWRAILSLAEGGWWGAGFGEIPNRLPFWHTDGVFSALAFQGGLLSAAAAIALLLLFAIGGIHVAMRAGGEADRFLAGSLTAILFLSGASLIATNLGFLPWLSAWMPFVGYGPMFMLLTWCSVGALLAIARDGRGSDDPPPARWRGILACSLAGVVALGLIVGLFARHQWAKEYIEDHPAMFKKAEPAKPFVPRGKILDHGGNVLAESVEAYDAFLTPGLIASSADALEEIILQLDLDPETTRSRFQRGLGHGNPHAEVVLARGLTHDKKLLLENLSQKRRFRWAIRFERADLRRYPQGAHAAHLLGFLAHDRRGATGIEHDCQEPLAAGTDVSTTLDRGIQETADAALADAMRESGAKWGAAIVADAQSGAILAWSQAPFIDPNDRSTYDGSWTDRLLSGGFEPGSLIKPVTAAIALEEGIATPETRINCEQGRWEFSGATILDHVPHGDLTLSEAFHARSNIALAKLGAQLGPEKLHHRLYTWGFGKQTGVLGQGEIPGMLRPPARSHPADTACIAYGQGILVTAPQIVAAYCAIANNGLLPPLHAVPGDRRDAVPVMTPTTAATLLNILREGTLPPQGTSAGPVILTATIQKLDPTTGKYSTDRRFLAACGFHQDGHGTRVALIALDEPASALEKPRTDLPTYLARILGACPQP